MKKIIEFLKRIFRKISGQSKQGRPPQTGPGDPPNNPPGGG